MSRETRLAQRAAQGDRRAFAAIYERYHQDLYRFCLAMVGSPQDAQDALQNTMVKALRALPGEKREIKLKPWLYRVARNESIEILRRRRDGAELEPQLAGEAGIAETAESRERLRTLLADLEQLPERQRAALVMRELSGLDFDQIGAAFQTSPAAARQALYEARLSLRQLQEGREMRCADVMRELSDADGRVIRRRKIQAHLRGCADCRAFREEIAHRRQNLAAIAPLPLAASAGVLHSVLGAKVGGGVLSGGLAGQLGAGAGKAAGVSAIVKSAATVAVVAAVGVSAADRANLIDLPLDGKAGSSAAQAPAGRNPADGRGASARTAAGAEAAGRAGSRGRDSGAPRRTGREAGTARRAAGRGRPRSSGSRAQRGQNPPGGGHGRSASERHGRPKGLPEAAAHGRQTSTSRESGHRSAALPASGGSSSPHRRPAAPSRSAPASKPTPHSRPVAPPKTTTPLPPSTEHARGHESEPSSPAEGASSGLGG